MRLIDADALMKKVWDADTRIGYVQVVDVGDIKNAPTIDFTVCKYCKYHIQEDEYWYCNKWQRETKEYWFCSRGGERE